MYIPFCAQTPQEYVSLLQARMERPENANYTWNTYAPFGYDTAWTIALMLNATNNILKQTNFSDGRQRRLEDFTYSDFEMSKLFFEQLGNTEFVGVSVGCLLRVDHYSMSQNHQCVCVWTTPS